MSRLLWVAVGAALMFFVLRYLAHHHCGQAGRRRAPTAATTDAGTVPPAVNTTAPGELSTKFCGPGHPDASSWNPDLYAGAGVRYGDV